jgi:hypothetical protein
LAVVHFPRALLPHTGGLEQVTIEAPRVKELQDALVARFPGLAGEIDQLAVAIDGEVRPDAAYETLLPLTEIYLVPKIAGGCRF